MKIVSRSYRMDRHSSEDHEDVEVEHKPPPGDGWRLERSHVVKFPWPRLVLVWVHQEAEHSEVVKELASALCHYANADWIEGERDPAELARTTLEELGLLVHDDLPRTPEGHINNCALANSDKESNCQICAGQCPDKLKFDRAEPEWIR